MLSPNSKAKLMLSRDLKMERSITTSIASLQEGLNKSIPPSVLEAMLDFLGSVIEREDEPREEDLVKFEALFSKELARAQAKDIVGVYKILQLKVELKKCRERVKDSLAKVRV
jgi:uncharacterized protein YPO0396